MGKERHDPNQKLDRHSGTGIFKVEPKKRTLVSHCCCMTEQNCAEGFRGWGKLAEERTIAEGLEDGSVLDQNDPNWEEPEEVEEVEKTQPTEQLKPQEKTLQPQQISQPQAESA